MIPNVRGPYLRGWKNAHSRRHPDAGKHPGAEPLPRRQDRPRAASDEEREYHFPSRPWRFGKSLPVDTPKELSEGNGELFRGPVIHGEWDWTVRHPVVRISFGGRTFAVPGHPDTNLDAQLGKTERDAGVGRLGREAPERFAHLIRSLHGNSGQRVVVLADEYDKPVPDAPAEPDMALANRDFPDCCVNWRRLGSIRRRHSVLWEHAGVPLPGCRCRSWRGLICRPAEFGRPARSARRRPVLSGRRCDPHARRPARTRAADRRRHARHPILLGTLRPASGPTGPGAVLDGLGPRRDGRRGPGRQPLRRCAGPHLPWGRRGGRPRRDAGNRRRGSGGEHVALRGGGPGPVAPIPRLPTTRGRRPSELRRPPPGRPRRESRGPCPL